MEPASSLPAGLAIPDSWPAWPSYGKPWPSATVQLSSKKNISSQVVQEDLPKGKPHACLLFYPWDLRLG